MQKQLRFFSKNFHLTPPPYGLINPPLILKFYKKKSAAGIQNPFVLNEQRQANLYLADRVFHSYEV